MEDKKSQIWCIIKDAGSIPTMPGIITKLNTLAESGRSSAQELARVVSSDQVLSAKVLRLVNSPFYGFSGRVSTISNALILLGVNVVKSLALSSVIFEIMEKNIIGLWEHSLGAGVAANIIARKLKLQECEEISTAALLHDIGKVIIKLYLEEDYIHLLKLIEQKDFSIREAEYEMLKTDHAEIGEWLAGAWYLPDKLKEPLACHHNIDQAHTHLICTSVVHVADVLIKAAGFGFSGDDLVPMIHPTAWEKLRIDALKLEEIIGELEDKLVELKNFSLEIQSNDSPQP
jgi:putative nucleotidyltransferase with HDIG domain